MADQLLHGGRFNCICKVCGNHFQKTLKQFDTGARCPACNAFNDLGHFREVQPGFEDGKGAKAKRKPSAIPPGDRIAEALARPPRSSRATTATISSPVKEPTRRVRGTSTFFLDTETTGLGAADRIVEIAIVRADGSVAMDTLVNPRIPIPPAATQIHGIRDDMVERSPTFESIWPRIRSLLSGQQVIIYNKAFDARFLPDGLACAEEVRCAMLEYAERRGERNYGRRGYKWHTLAVAARQVGHKWTGDAHRALADALACRSIWLWLQKSR